MSVFQFFRCCRPTWIGFVMVLILAGCEGTRTDTVKPSDTETRVARAMQLEQAGDHDSAAREYLSLARSSQPPQRITFLIRATDSLIGGKHFHRARGVLDELSHLPLSAEQSIQLNLLRAQIALQEEQPKQALSAAPQLPASAPLRLRILTHTIRAQAYLLLGQPFTSVQERITLDPLIMDPMEAHKNRKAIWQTLLQVPTPTLHQQRLDPPPDVFSGWIELAKIGKTAVLKQRGFDSQLFEWRDRYRGHPAAQQLVGELLNRYQQLQQRPESLALLLPVTGKYAQAARAIRDGFIAAHYQSEDDRQTQTVRVYDTAKGDISDLYTQAVSDGASFVVGPLDKNAVSTLAQSESLSIPVLALNVADNKDHIHNNLFQFGLTPEDEAIQIAERAMAEGFRRAIAIAPEGVWGDRVVNAFAERFSDLGGELLEQERYPGDKSDFSGAIRGLLNLDESEDRYKKIRRIVSREVKYEPRRRKDVDFVFMPAYPRQARLIAPQLLFHHASDLPVYATSSAYDGIVNPRADRDLDGVAFCDIPWILSTDDAEHPLRKPISRLWPKTMQRYARFYAMGIDAYNILPYLDWLRQEPQERFEGKTGSLSVAVNNQIHRGLLWARFANGRATLIPQLENTSIFAPGQGLQTIP